MEWRLLDVLFFGSTRTSQLLNSVRNLATVDARWVCFMYTQIILVWWLHRVGVNIYISAWASALLVRTELGNAKAFVERNERL